MLEREDTSPEGREGGRGARRDQRPRVYISFTRGEAGFSRRLRAGRAPCRGGAREAFGFRKTPCARQK